jgi:hypothetical protein
VNGLEHADFAEEVDLCHSVLRLHGPAARAGREPVGQLERIVPQGQQRLVADLGVAGFIPGDAGQ